MALYKDIWRHIFPEKTTLAEVDFIVEKQIEHRKAFT
jgi:hypothetical protein